jgi:phosphatidate phosphatase APP1
VEVWDARPGTAVISDLDDTLLDSGVLHKLRLLANLFLHSTWELTTFPGAPQVVSALAGRGLPVLPTFYLSGSPWALQDRISEFFDRSGFPHGTMILRRYSQESLDPYVFKHPHLLEIVDSLPNKSFILLGDSGEKDPEVYAALARERPGRVKATYIHLVTSESPRSARFSGMTAFKQWPDAGQDMIAKGLLPKAVSAAAH